MKKLKYVLLAGICIAMTATGAAGCVSVDFTPAFRGGPIATGSGEQELFTFDVGDITEINVIMSNIDLEHYSAPSDAVTLMIQPNLIEYITVEEKDGVLTVWNTGNIIPSGKTPVLTVSSPSLKGISLWGAGRVNVHDTVTADSFTINIAGAGSGSVSLDVRRLSVRLSGAGDFSFAGTADTAEIRLSGAGSIDALPLQTRRADVTLSGAGTIRVSCSEYLRVSASGVGTVEYRGQPTLVDDSTGDLVNVRRVN